MLKRTLTTAMVGRHRAVSSSKHGATSTATASQISFLHGPVTPKSFSSRSLSRWKTPAAARTSTSQSHRRAHMALAQYQYRTLSTEIRAQQAATAAANAAMASEASGGAASGAAAAAKKSEPNFFLDNLGKIFLLGIVSVIVTLVRSTYNTSNKNKVRDFLEDIAAIDPKELEEFRMANSELTLETMRKLFKIYYKEHARNGSSSGGPTSSYGEFVTTVRRIMATRFPKEGEFFTVQLGHYLDRIFLDVLEHRGEQKASSSSSSFEGDTDELPVALLFVAMCSAMNGSVSDRIRILHELISIEEEQKELQFGSGMNGDSSNISKNISSGSNNNMNSSSSSSSINGNMNIDSNIENNSNRNDNESAAAGTANFVPLPRVRDIVGYLQETCQLPPDTQIVPTERKYPAQQWRRATPEDMVPDLPGIDDSNSADNDNDNGVDLVEFAAILRTKSVCAWGECYMKWKPDASEFGERNPPNTNALTGTSIAN